MKKKKYLVGGIMAGVSAATSIIGAIKQSKLLKEQQAQEEHNGLLRTKEQDTYDLENFDSDGYELNGYYKLGGGIKSPISSLKGGKALPLSSDAVVMKGNTHKQGGIDIGDNVEVENNEVIKGNRVYSDSLKTNKRDTYADAVKKLATKRGKLEAGLTALTPIGRNTAKRKIEVLNSKEDKLFNEQQMKNDNQGGTNLEKGGFAQTLGAGIPYLDNVVNAGLTLFTPKVQKPTYIKPRKLQTSVNVNDQLNSVNKAVDSSAKFIEGNTSNSSAARNAITNARLKGSDIKANIYAKKENAETSLKNADIANRQRIDTINANKTDRYNQMQTARQGEIQSRISSNFADLSDDFISKRNFDESKRYNNEQLAAIKSMYNNGVVTRTDNVFKEKLRQLLGE